MSFPGVEACEMLSWHLFPIKIAKWTSDEQVPGEGRATQHIKHPLKSYNLISREIETWMGWGLCQVRKGSLRNWIAKQAKSFFNK
jgi:hypothetical protein